MFGYVTVNGDLLEKAEKDRYQAAYCGLCRQLGEAYGGPGRATLTYDMTFLSMLLGSLYALPETQDTMRCPVNPLRQCAYFTTEATAYAADMNVLLAYHKSRDDWKDDRSLSALGKVKLLGERAKKAEINWPMQRAAVTNGLADMADMERRNELNPDLPTNCFGHLLGALSAWRNDDWSEPLYRLGAALGRFIYLMDACLDLPSDIRHERYNPLIAQSSEDFTPMLTLLIGECTRELEALPLERDVRILRNILYSGVWVQYQSKKEGQEKRHGSN